MKLLFVSFEYTGERDAGAQCIAQLRLALLQNGVSSDVLTYNWQNAAQQAPIADEAGCIHVANTWYRHARMRRKKDGRIQMTPLQWAAAACARGASVLLEGRHYAEHGFPKAAAATLGKKLRALCLENRYDWVVSVSYPFVNHLTVLRWCPPGIKKALYNLDPYYNNETYAPADRDKRCREEVKAYQQADCIFCTPEQLRDYQIPAFDAVRKKLHPLPYPKLAPLRRQQPCAIPFDASSINCLYLGTVYSDIRRPDGLLQLFEKLVAAEPRIRLYIVGKKFGATAGAYLAEYEKRLDGHLVCMSPIPPEQTADAMQQADVLINLGNTMHNQLPSKVFDYIASGKPILNLSVTPACTSIPLLQRYPRVLQCFNDTCCEDAVVQQALAFCRAGKTPALPWAAVQAAYPQEQLPAVTKTFLQCLL